jgi:hypothetical protein
MQVVFHTSIAVRCPTLCLYRNDGADTLDKYSALEDIDSLSSSKLACEPIRSTVGVAHKISQTLLTVNDMLVLM